MILYTSDFITSAIVFIHVHDYAQLAAKKFKVVGIHLNKLKPVMIFKEFPATGVSSAFNKKLDNIVQKI